MAEGHLSRRSLLGIGVCGSLALLESTLAGCSRIGPRLASRRGDLPERWVRRLPADWRPKWVEGPAQVLEASKAEASGRPALAQLSDGWATSLSGQTWIPFGQEGVLARLDPSAGPASRLFAPEGQPILAFPWSRNPWVLVLRDRPDLAQRADLGWDVLLEPSLAGKVVLPSSPRVVMALVGEDPQRLCRLRRQALALDDRHGINLLLSGPAQAAVLPRPQVVPLLRRDPRLAALLPAEGSPMAWSLLLRPAGGGEIAPLQDWLADLLRPPLLPFALAAGWVPPLPRPTLEAATRGFSPSLTRVLLPPEPVLQRGQNLPPLEPKEQIRLQALWTSTDPCQRT